MVDELRIPDVVAAKARANGAGGWLAQVPDVIAASARDWHLSVDDVFADGTEAMVLAVRRRDGSPAVLKLGIPRPGDHLAREAEVLRRVDGDGCPILYAADLERSAILIERLGSPMSAREMPVDQRIDVLADCCRRIWRPVADAGLPSGADKATRLQAWIVEAWERLGRPCSERAVDVALAAAERCRAAHDPERAVLVHGDVHQWNALEAPEGGWRLIDPDGLIADPAYDLGVLMREDPVELLRDGPIQRAEILARRSGVDVGAVWDWGLVERVSTGLVCVEIELEPVGTQMLAAADAVVDLSP